MLAQRRRHLVNVVAILGVVFTGLLAAALRPTGGGGGAAELPGPGEAISPPRAPGRAPAGDRPVAGTSQSARSASADAAGVTPVGPPSELVPLPSRAFTRPIAAYRTYAAGQAGAMERATATIVAATRRGDRGAARAAWGDAYERFARIGAAYGALGRLGVAIDVRPGSLPGGVRDPRFRGLHAVERGLWTRTSLRDIVPVAVDLDASARKLPRRLSTMAIAPLDLALRAHEILEDAQRDELGGGAARWSGAGVRATAGAYEATRAVLRVLRPVLNGRGDAFPPVESAMAVLGRRLDAVRRAGGGHWPPAAALGVSVRERLDGALSSALEALAGLPGSLETIRPAPVPRIAGGR